MRGWGVALARWVAGVGRGHPVGNYSPWLVATGPLAKHRRAAKQTPRSVR